MKLKLNLASTPTTAAGGSPEASQAQARAPAPWPPARLHNDLRSPAPPTRPRAPTPLDVVPWAGVRAPALAPRHGLRASPLPMCASLLSKYEAGLHPVAAADSSSPLSLPAGTFAGVGLPSMARQVCSPDALLEFEQDPALAELVKDCDFSPGKIPS